MTHTYTAKYRAQALTSAPRDLANACLARFKAIYPTVQIFHCTFVCDARCEMCSKWKRADRKSGTNLEEIEQAFSEASCHRIENANASGGEPTTRNDLVDMCLVMLDKLPRLRKFGLNTTGLTPHRAIPMLTEIMKLCH